MSDEMKPQNADLSQVAKNKVGGTPIVQHPLYPPPQAAPEPLPPELPTPTFPTMELPSSPVAPDNSIGGFKPAGDGEPPMNIQPDRSQVPLPSAGVSRILIGIPLLAITLEFFESFTKFWTEMCTLPHPNYEIMFHVAYRKPVHMAEEYLVEVAKFNKCTHILLMDDDIYDISKNYVDLLLAADKDCIGGVMYASKFPHAMCVFRRFTPERKVIDMPVDTSMYRLYEIPCTCQHCNIAVTGFGDYFCPNCGKQNHTFIQQADLIPFAFTLIKLSVFDKIKTPWFHCTNKYPTDSWFADRLIEAGMTEYAHMGVRLNHAGVSDVTKPHYMQMGMEASKRRQAVVEISAEQMDMHQRLLMSKMNATEATLRAKPPIIKDGKVVANADQGTPTTLATHGR